MRLSRRARAIIIALVVIVVASGAAVWLLVLRPEPLSDRQQVLRLVADVERAIEQKDAAGLLRHVAAEYGDSRGFNRRTVRQLVLAGLRDERTMDLTVEVDRVQVQGDTARFVADVSYSLDGTVSAGGAGHLTVEGHLRREHGRWKVVRAEGWQDAGGAYM